MKWKKFKIPLLTIFFIGLYLSTVYGPSFIESAIRRHERYDSEISDSTGHIIAGKREGVWKHFDRKGRLRRIQEFKSDTLNGKDFFYDSNGNPKLFQFYYKGVLVDTSKFFVDGWLNYSEYRDSNGVLQGDFKTFVKGVKVQEGNYKDGEYHGTFKTYYQETGQVKEIYFYENGEETGTWKFYDKAGNLERTIEKKATAGNNG